MRLFSIYNKITDRARPYQENSALTGNYGVRDWNYPGKRLIPADHFDVE